MVLCERGIRRHKETRMQVTGGGLMNLGSRHLTNEMALGPDLADSLQLNLN